MRSILPRSSGGKFAANSFAAKYSLPHAAAALILRGTAGYRAFTEEVVHDPAVAASRRRVTVRAKFRELAGLVLSPDGVARIEAFVDRLDEVPRLNDLVAALRDDRAR